MTKNDVQLHGSVGYKVINKATGDFNIGVFSGSSDTHVSILIEQTRETIHFEADENGNLSHELFEIMFAVSPSAEVLGDVPSNPNEVVTSEGSNPEVNGSTEAAPVVEAPVEPTDAAIEKALDASTVTLDETDEVPSQPPVDNAHVVEGGEQFQEGDSATPVADNAPVVEGAPTDTPTDVVG